MNGSALASVLRRAGVSRVLQPGDPGAEAALGVFDTSIVFTPDAIVAASSIADVEATVAAAQREGVPLLAVGTGHGLLGNVSEGIVLATRELASVTVDVDARTARVTAGATWTDVLEATTPHGIAGLCGSAPGVGVISYLLGGGLGPIAREYGFSADHVRSLEVVTPAQGALTVSAEQHPELFWALRGGKSGLGIVVAATIDLLPITSLYGGGLYFAADSAGDVLHAVAEWAPSLPEASTASIALLRLPPAPSLPEQLRGRSVAHVRYASTQDATAADAELAPIRRIATPLVDGIRSLPYSQIGTIHGDPSMPMPVMSGGVALESLAAAQVDVLLDAVGPDRDIPLSAVELRALGGALARPAAEPGIRAKGYRCCVCRPSIGEPRQLHG
ncbi:MAG: FAD-binding oxidoreductase [Microbacteriaceae bacterium]|nr:FAD-binding oxidoreductase [Microbacteriaceae bacterium]